LVIGNEPKNEIVGSSFISKAAAKVLLIFDIHKFFLCFLQKKKKKARKKPFSNDLNRNFREFRSI